MAIELSPRDLAVLLFTWQNRFVATRQLHRAFWPGASRSAANQRLVALRDRGLLGFRHYPWLSERVLYFASLRGNRELAAAGLLDPSHLNDVPRQPGELTPALRHDLTVVDLRLRLEETGVDGRTWVSDHQLRLERARVGPATRVPDGIFGYAVGKVSGLGLLEFENATYRRPRVAAILSRLRAQYPSHQVLVVTKSAAREGHFRDWAAWSGVYADAPHQVAVSNQGSVGQKGLDAGFLDLQGSPWPPPMGGLDN
jgi:hypothetical protein